MQGLVQSWQWSPSDTILHSLPLHHIHGIVNALYCPAYVGAAVSFLPKFSTSQVWKEIMVRKLGHKSALTSSSSNRLASYFFSKRQDLSSLLNIINIMNSPYPPSIHAI